MMATQVDYLNEPINANLYIRELEEEVARLTTQNLKLRSLVQQFGIKANQHPAPPAPEAIPEQPVPAEPRVVKQ